MASISETSFPSDYRSARKAFIAACIRAPADSIARVHPAVSGPRGNPLFLDSVALGPRDAGKALLLVAGGDGTEGGMGAGLLSGLLDAGIRPKRDARLVMVPALNPYGLAFGRKENESGIDLDAAGAARSWSFAMLRDILTEDMAHVTKLRVLELAQGSPSWLEDRSAGMLARTLAQARPASDIRVARLFLVPGRALAESRAVVTRALAEL
jgi:hypothetical protein